MFRLKTKGLSCKRRGTLPTTGARGCTRSISYDISYETSLCLHYKPQAIASSCLYLSLKFLKLQLTATNEKPWWEPFGVDITTLEAICAKILDLYTSPAQTSKPSPSPALQSPSTSTESPAQSPSTPPPTPISPSSPGANGSVDNLHPSNDHKESSFKITEGSRDRKYEARNNHKHPVDGRRDNYHHPNSHNRTPQLSEQREDYRPRALPDAHDRRRHEPDRHHAGVKRRHGGDTDSDVSHVDKKYRKTVPALSGNSSTTGFSLTSRNNPTNFVSSVQWVGSLRSDKNLRPSLLSLAYLLIINSTGNNFV